MPNQDCAFQVDGRRAPDQALRIMLLGASLESENLGVRALTVGAIKCVLNRYPNAFISLLDYSNSPSEQIVKLNGREVAVPLVNLRFSKRFYLRNNIALLILLALLLKLIPTRKLRAFVARRNETLRRIQEVDIVGSLAGGDSFSDIYGLTRLLYVTLPQILVLLMGKKLILLPQTFGPFRTKMSRAIASHIIRRAAQVYTRDRRGLKDVGDLLGARRDTVRLAFCYDVAFALDAIPPNRLEVDGLPAAALSANNLVGLNVSGLLAMGGYRRNNMFGLKDNYRALLNRVIDILITKKAANILLVPHVFGLEDSESDLGVCDQVFEELRTRYPDRLGVVRGSYDQSEIKHIIGMCGFFIGSRMHACIAAVSQGIPTVCIAYSDKFAGVMNTIASEAVVADARHMDANQILTIIERSYDGRLVSAQYLARRMTEVRSNLQELLQLVKDTSQKEVSTGASTLFAQP